MFCNPSSLVLKLKTLAIERKFGGCVSSRIPIHGCGVTTQSQTAVEKLAARLSGLASIGPHQYLGPWWRGVLKLTEIGVVGPRCRDLEGWRILVERIRDEYASRI